MNQFFYTRKEPIQGTDPLEFKEYLDSFNIEKVIRTIVMENDNRKVISVSATPIKLKSI